MYIHTFPSINYAFFIALFLLEGSPLSPGAFSRLLAALFMGCISANYDKKCLKAETSIELLEYLFGRHKKTGRQKDREGFAFKESDIKPQFIIYECIEIWIMYSSKIVYTHNTNNNQKEV